jgi:hypothetical protein
MLRVDQISLVRRLVFPNRWCFYRWCPIAFNQRAVSGQSLDRTYNESEQAFTDSLGLFSAAATPVEPIPLRIAAYLDVGNWPQILAALS